jgi:acyl carrier protein
MSPADADLADVLDIVRTQIADGDGRLQDVRVGPDSRADLTPGWDSIAMVNILFRAEEVFDVEFTSLQMEQVRSVADLLAAIAEARRARRSVRSAAG